MCSAPASTIASPQQRDGEGSRGQSPRSTKLGRVRGKWCAQRQQPELTGQSPLSLLPPGLVCCLAGLLGSGSGRRWTGQRPSPHGPWIPSRGTGSPRPPAEGVSVCRGYFPPALAPRQPLCCEKARQPGQAFWDFVPLGRVLSPRTKTRKQWRGRAREEKTMERPRLGHPEQRQAAVGHVLGTGPSSAAAARHRRRPPPCFPLRVVGSCCAGRCTALMLESQISCPIRGPGSFPRVKAAAAQAQSRKTLAAPRAPHLCPAAPGSEEATWALISVADTLMEASVTPDNACVCVYR